MLDWVRPRFMIGFAILMGWMHTPSLSVNIARMWSHVRI